LEEKGIVTSGDDLPEIARFLRPDGRPYRAADVIAVLLDRPPPPALESGPSRGSIADRI
jgi:hypothetical protein